MKNQDLKFTILATDVLLFTIHEKKIYIRLIPVDRPPYFINQCGLPGGLVKPNETAEEAAWRHLQHKGFIKQSKVYLEQLFTFSGIDRDPRGRVVSVAYFGCVAWDNLNSLEKSDTPQAYWQELKKANKLAYDHNEILNVGLKRLQSKIKYTTLIAKFLPKEFAISELQFFYELISGEKVDKRNFIKRINLLDFLISVNKKTQGLRARPAQLYKFKSQKVLEIPMISNKV
jgi:8-oxo-dGTP diphosphatase